MVRFFGPIGWPPFGVMKENLWAQYASVDPLQASKLGMEEAEISLRGSFWGEVVPVGVVAPEGTAKPEAVDGGKSSLPEKRGDRGGWEDYFALGGMSKEGGEKTSFLQVRIKGEKWGFEPMRERLGRKCGVVKFLARSMVATKVVK